MVTRIEGREHEITYALVSVASDHVQVVAIAAQNGSRIQSLSPALSHLPECFILVQSSTHESAEPPESGSQGPRRYINPPWICSSCSCILERLKYYVIEKD